jgi:hypothetical protein
MNSCDLNNGYRARRVSKWPFWSFDVHNCIALSRDHYYKIGFGADYVKTLSR